MLKTTEMRILLFSLTFLVIHSCSNSDVESEMAKFCDFLKQHAANPEGREECYILMEKILEKYSYDPAALAEIMDASEKCY